MSDQHNPYSAGDAVPVDAADSAGLADRGTRLGAAIIASVGLGLHADFATAVRAMTRIGQVFLPQPEHARTYEQLYRRVYCRMYERLQPLYRDIRAITGYPSHD